MLWFEELTGLQVNTSKTLLYKVNELNCWKELMNLWNFKEGKLPDTYLGLPLGLNFKSKPVWQGLIEKFQSRLANWKRRYLTKAGPLVLIKSTLATFPIFMLSLLVLPASVEEELESIMREFLWGSSTGKKKYHLLCWNKVCTPLGCGGLGINRLRDVNISLLCKWLWDFGNGEEKIWRRS